MALTFREKTGGNVEIFKDGNRISTATREFAESQGAVPEESFAINTGDGTVSQGETPEIRDDAPPTDQIETPADAPTPVQAPEPPEPEAPQQQESFFTGLSENVKNTKEAFQSELKRQMEDVNKRIEQSQTRLDELTEEQEALLETDIKPLTEPFRQELQEAERERLHINENFQANQELVRELETLLTEGNEMIRGQRERFASRASVKAGVTSAMEDVTARAGVIQAVMSARSGQIGEAQRMIDRTINTINADRQDQLNFYETVFNFTEKQRDEEGNKLVKLDKTKRDFLNTKLSTLKTEMDTAKQNAERIKQAMIDPDTALLYAQAGVKITDSQEEVASKVAQASYAKEVRNIRNQMVQQGFTPLAPGENAPAGAEVQTVTDSLGNEKRFYKQPEGDFEFVKGSANQPSGVFDPSTGSFTPTGGGGPVSDTQTGELGLSPEAEMVLGNPALLEDFTATRRGELLTEIARAGEEAETVAQKSTQRMVENALTTIETMRDTDTIFGKALGAVSFGKFGQDSALKRATGFTGIISPFQLGTKGLPGTAGRDANEFLETLKAQLTIPQLEFARGLGRMNREQFNTLKEASQTLDRRLSTDMFISELERVQDTLLEVQADMAGRGASSLEVSDDDYEAYLEAISQ